MEDNTLTPCATWEEKLAALHPNDLSAAERAALNEHMAGCPGCAAAFADYKKMDSLIREVFLNDSPLELPEWLTQDDLATKLPPLPVSRQYQNLPSRLDDFFGRQTDLEYVTEGLNSFRSLLAIEGMGGVGKTTLATEVAYQCLQGSDLMPNTLFDAAVWISARGRLEQKLWLHEILDTIARVLDYPSVIQLRLDEKRTRVNELLHTYQTLVIIDNFDTIVDPDLLTWIQQIPEPSKILVTSRDARELHEAWTLHLRGLENDEAFKLIRHHAQKLELSVMESPDLLNLVRVTSGNPQAIVMILGGLKSGALDLHQVLDGLDEAGDMLDHLFTRSWSTLAEQDETTQHVLLAMSFFASSASQEAIRAVAQISDLQMNKALMRLTELSLIEVYEDLEQKKTRYGLHPLTRAFVGTKLAEVPDWAQAARERWKEWWLIFTKAHGGPDEMEWARQYDPIEEEWENLMVVCEWCEAHDQYETMRALWHTERLLWMTSIYGYWKERIARFRWIREAAEKRGDKAIAVEAMTEEGFTLTQMGRVEEAEKVMTEAWKQRRLAPMGVQVTLAENLVQWHIRTNNLAGAQHWLKMADRLVRKPNLSELERPRHKLTIKYYYGVKHILKGDRNRAEMYFNEILEGAQKINWQRGMIYAQQFLADIARAQGKYDEAERSLTTGLEVVERNKDRRRTAYYKRSLAYLALQQGRQNKVEEAIHWAQQALDDFERLGMRPEVGKLRHLLDHLKASLVVKTKHSDHRFHRLLGHPNASPFSPPVEDVLQQIAGVEADNKLNELSLFTACGRCPTGTD